MSSSYLDTHLSSRSTRRFLSQRGVSPATYHIIGAADPVADLVTAPQVKTSQSTNLLDGSQLCAHPINPKVYSQMLCLRVQLPGLTIYRHLSDKLNDESLTGAGSLGAERAVFSGQRDRYSIFASGVYRATRAWRGFSSRKDALRYYSLCRVEVKML
jgi:hypothetical protein